MDVLHDALKLAAEADPIGGEYLKKFADQEYGNEETPSLPDLAESHASRAGDDPFATRKECREGMSNFDHEIDSGFEGKLRTEKFWGRHAAWNFNGQVWFQDGQFHEQVWVYGSPRGVISADSLRELMNKVNDQYGSD